MSNVEVVVYGKPGCQQCKMMYSKLLDRGYNVKHVDILEDEGALELLKSYGYQSVPVTAVEGNLKEAVLGFRLPEVEKKVKARIAA